MTNITTLIKEFNNQKKALTDRVSKEFVSLFKPYLDKYPEIYAFHFVAYTPYFNDGDPCVYSIYDYMFVTQTLSDPLDVTDEDEIPEVGPHEGEYIWNNDKYELKELKMILNSIPNEIMESSFGEGHFVITREGLDIRGYDHD